MLSEAKKVELKDGYNGSATGLPNSALQVPTFTPHQKHVRFPEDESQLVVIFDTSGTEAWHVDPDIPNHVIIDAYAKACLQLDRPPISTLIEQLSKVTVPLVKTKIPAIILKGTQLTKTDVDALECIFKYCTTYHLSLENTNLNDESLACVLEALHFYASCSELCLARNSRITADGISHVAEFISKYPQLNWLDLRGIQLTPVSARRLSQSLTSQRNEARKLVTNFLNVCTGEEAVNFDSSRDAEVDFEAFQLTFNVFLSHLPTVAEVNTLSGALQRLPLLCLRGLHLGETGLSGNTLYDVTGAIRVSGYLRDLRLPGNRLGAHDIQLMTPLLRYYPGLQVLDLSHNDLGDEGYRLLADALFRPSYPYNIPTRTEETSTTQTCCNLRRLYLAETGLRPVGAKYFASCLPALSCLSHLELSDNPQLGCLGVLALRSNLQAHTRRRLVYLGLAHCGVACQGAIALAEILGDSPRALRRVDLTGNHVAEAGLMAISKSIPLWAGLVQLQGLEDNRPLRSSMNGGRGPFSFETSIDANDHKNHNGVSVPTSPAAKRLSSKFRFLIPKSPLSPAPPLNTIREASEVPLSKRPQSLSGSETLEPSQLHLDLLQTIHSQLAANVDKRFSSHKNRTEKEEYIPSSLRQSSARLRFFRGYARFPSSIRGMLRELDPRHLCGDTSESESDSSSESD